jgi:hypothetical protein
MSADTVVGPSNLTLPGAWCRVIHQCRWRRTVVVVVVLRGGFVVVVVVVGGLVVVVVGGTVVVVLVVLVVVVVGGGDAPMALLAADHAGLADPLALSSPK